MSRVRNFVEPFALTRPHAPEMVELEPAMADVHGGVTIVKANETEGLLVLMLAYLNQTKNDKLILLVNDNKGPSTTIAEGKESDDTPLRLPAGLLQKGLNRIKIHIERTSGNDELTPELVLYHRTSPPGDLPPVLNLTVSHKVINQAEADKFKVTVTYANLQWYDRIFVSCNGAHHQYQLTPSSVSPLPPVPQSVVIDIPKDKLIEGGNDKTFEIKYRVVDYLTNPSGPPTWSDAVFVEVNLDKISQEPPTLVNAVSPIDVLASEGGVKVRAEFQAALANDKATLKIVNGLPGSSFPQVAFNTNHRANFTFSVAFLLAHQGKTIQVSWVLIRDGVPSGESPPLEVVIDKIAVDDPRLPKPTIDGANGNTLEVAKLEANAQLRIVEWPLQAANQIANLRYEVLDKNGDTLQHLILKDEVLKDTNGLITAALVVWLGDLADQSQLTIVFELNFEGVADPDSRVRFPVQRYIIANSEPLLIDSSQMQLSGINYYLASENFYVPDWHRTGYRSEGSYEVRVPTTGAPPYIYYSENPDIATVDTHSGLVYSVSNGTTKIVVRDGKGRTAEYSVACSNVFEVVGNEHGLHQGAAYAMLAQLNLEPIPYSTANDHSELLYQFQNMRSGARFQGFWGVGNPPSGLYVRITNYAADPSTGRRGLEVNFTTTSTTLYSIGRRPKIPATDNS
ncbi:hypothetical protein [Pseudomonas atacamensis]|uniref:hypothetical protein n=1 Tax=Pseudomonas atacamensis TaxID=2565368 RepID=UPI001FAE05DA|nr:hypothetical protein [Pseudomonas atacamensis]MCI9877656.1 hypothetical protein [Pseudomonas atacamensis]